MTETNSTPTSSPYTCRSSCSYFIFPPPNHRRPTRKEIRRGLRKGEPAKNRQMIKQQKVDQQGLQHRCNQGFACLVCVMGLCIAGEFFGERARGIEPQYSNPNLQALFFPVQSIVCVLITASLLVGVALLRLAVQVVRAVLRALLRLAVQVVRVAVDVLFTPFLVLYSGSHKMLILLTKCKGES